MNEVYVFTIVVVALLWGWLIGHARDNTRSTHASASEPSWGNFPKEESE
jgi:hypothetical protein